MSSDEAVQASGEGLKTATKWKVNWAFTVLEGVLWMWSILVCVPYWLANEDYAYGWFVPVGMFLFLWMRLGSQDRQFWVECGREARGTWTLSPWLIAIPGLMLFPLEVYREEYHQSGIVLWGINLAKVAFSMAGAWWLGGRRLLMVTLFPLLFFLTAVPWPARLAHPVQQNLMIGVAQVLNEILLWMDVPVRTQGAVLELTNGTVGIVEACSGIRSLQSGMMVSLAVGELMWLTRRHRAVLVAGAIGLALFSNLVRTFVLCWIVEKSGSDAMHAKHDLVGNTAMYSLYALIFLWGMWLARGRQGIWPRQDAGSWGERIAQLSWDHVPDFRPLLGLTVAMFLTVHGWYWVLEYRAKPQTKPAFEVLAQGGTGNEKQEFAGDVWAQLGATEGESLVRRDGSAPMGMVSGSHLFWRPSAMSRTALHHRPDVCMPGSGWKSEGEVGETTVEVSGHPLKFVVFRFSREEKTGRRVQALMLWGVWRNGLPVPFDFSDKLTALPEKYGMWPTDRHMLGIELVSVMVPYEKGPAPLELARAAVPKMFQYKPVVIEGNRGGNP
jgi:exosortase